MERNKANNSYSLCRSYSPILRRSWLGSLATTPSKSPVLLFLVFRKASSSHGRCEDHYKACLAALTLSPSSRWINALCKTRPFQQGPAVLARNTPRILHCLRSKSKANYLCLVLLPFFLDTGVWLLDCNYSEFE